jgi:hypothetical protein
MDRIYVYNAMLYTHDGTSCANGQTNYYYADISYNLSTATWMLQLRKTDLCRAYLRLVSCYTAGPDTSANDKADEYAHCIPYRFAYDSSDENSYTNADANKCSGSG